MVCIFPISTKKGSAITHGIRTMDNLHTLHSPVRNSLFNLVVSQLCVYTYICSAPNTEVLYINLRNAMPGCNMQYNTWGVLGCDYIRLKRVIFTLVLYYNCFTFTSVTIIKVEWLNITTNTWYVPYFNPETQNTLRTQYIGTFRGESIIKELGDRME